jgi:membrane protein YqaA with SNARE-associated domain
VTASLLATFGLYLGTYVVCLLAGLIPLINAEVYLVGVTLWAVRSPAQLPAIVVLASLGQMTAKVILYYTAAGAMRLPRGRYQARLEAARDRIERWRHRPLWVLAVSSTLGLPPFYLVSLAAGAMRIRMRTFLAIGTAGRLVHFAVVVAIAWWA